MNNRLKLHEELESISGPKKVYFQAPKNNSMIYPCILYKLDDINGEYADNIFYLKTRRYMVTVLDKDPDSEIPDLLLNYFQKISFDRSYTVDNLYHFVFTLYY